MSKITIHSPPATAQIKACAVDFDLRRAPVPVHLVQYDKTIPILAVSLYKGSSPYTLPADAEVNVRMNKRNNLCVYNPALGCNESRDVVYVAVTPQMTTQDGTFEPILEVVINSGVAGTSPLQLVIRRNPVQEDAIEDTSEVKTLTELVSQAAASATAAAQSASAAAASARKAAQSEQSAASSANAAASAAESSKQAAEASATAAQQTATDKEAAEQSATRAESAAKTAGDAATKVINEGVAEKLTEMQGIQEDVKARQQDVTEKQADVTANVELARQAALSNGYMQMGVDPDTGHLMYTRTTNLKDKLDFAIVNDTNLEVQIHG